jgi:hypothetical protein
MDRHRARLAAAAVALLGALAVWLVTTRTFPYYSVNHDEAVYLQQAGMLLEGQLNLYPPVEDAFRPWFFVEDGDRLYPKYAPVPAAMFALGMAAGTPELALAGIAAGIVALSYGVASELFDRQTGLLAAAFVVVSPLFLVNTAVFLPYAPTALLNLAFAYAYLRADRIGGLRWPAVAGIAVGLAFFSRPYTAVLFAAPFLVHACWTLWRARALIRRRLERPRDAGWVPPTLARQATTAAFGLGGVLATLAYNASVTGSATRFPYQAFGPRDGIGFGTRRLLGHEVQYTPELAVRANVEVLRVLFTEWVAGGLLGTGLAVLGIAVVARRGVTGGRGVTARQAVLAGVFVSVAVGNVYFWGNFNILGNLTQADDGLIGAMGPHYHYDLLLPTAAFAARGAIGASRRLRTLADDRIAGTVFAPRTAHVLVVAVLLVAAGGVGATSATLAAEPIDDNAERTDVYERAYEPFADGPPENSVVFLPGPYGDWLNHPFQPLRNDPGFDGEAVYALETRPFAVADAFPDRALYRYAHRGLWAPSSGSPEAARLTRVRDVRAGQVTLGGRFGVPNTTEVLEVRIESGDDGATYVAENASGDLDIRVWITPGAINLSGGVQPIENGTIVPDEDGEVRLIVTVGGGMGNVFHYRLDVPVRTTADRARALSPRVEWCYDVRACGGAAAYIPGRAPDGVFVRTNLSVTR